MVEVANAVMCGCPTYVSGDNITEIEAVTSLQSAWVTQECGDGMACGGCPPAPTGAFCEMTPPGSSAPGLCADKP